MYSKKKASIEYKEERRSRGFIDDNEKINGRVFNIGVYRFMFVG